MTSLMFKLIKNVDIRRRQGNKETQIHADKDDEWRDIYLHADGKRSIASMGPDKIIDTGPWKQCILCV